MNLEVMSELEACFSAVPGLDGVPVVWGIDPANHLKVDTYPRIGVYAGAPNERELFIDSSRVAYQIKIGYFVKLTEDWPKDKQTLAVLHDKARDLRKAFGKLYARQISGESTLSMDVEGGVEQEIAVLGGACMIGTTVTIVVLEGV